MWAPWESTWRKRLWLIPHSVAFPSIIPTFLRPMTWCFFWDAMASDRTVKVAKQLATERRSLNCTDADTVLRYVSDNLLLQPTVNKNLPLDECLKSVVQHPFGMAFEVIQRNNHAATIINGNINREVTEWMRRQWGLQNTNSCPSQIKPKYFLFCQHSKLLESNVQPFSSNSISDN